MANLWIDDLRPAPAGHLWAKNSAEAIEALERAGNPFSHISFDHDLGEDDTTRKVVLWLCENPDAWPATASVHTMNPVGRDWLVGMIQRYLTSTVIVPQGSVL